eukprot:SAG22_NODE_17695_length_300_cov_0.771144_2_plen_57_part_01
MVLPSSWFHYGAMNGSFLEELALRQNAVVQELHGLYGGLSSLCGFYQPTELRLPAIP